jgi:hypothetical protein
MKKLQSLLYPVAILILFISFIFASLHLVRGEVLFHTDLARDVLIVEDMVETRRPDLIGPRAGGIPGLFFGPIWYYAMIPFFIIGSGSPVAIGVFWLTMVTLAVLSAWYVSDRVFGKNVGFLSAVLYSAFLIPISPGFTQSFGSLIFSPIVFFLLFRFYQTAAKRYLVANVFVLGFLFHLQPAFGMLTIALSFLFSVYVVRKKKKLKYLLYYLLIIIPLSNYLVFEARHSFLQTRAFWDFITSPPASRIEITFLETVTNRFDGFLHRLNLLQANRIPAYILSLLANFFILYTAIKVKKLRSREFIVMFFVFYVSFWMLTFLFKGLVWDFYHWGFLPLVIIIFSALYNIIPKKVFVIVYLLVLIPAFSGGIRNALNWEDNFSGKNSSSWVLNKGVAEDLYESAGAQDFGYFVYSPDEFGFSIKYAMNYLQRQNANSGDLCAKKQITYLVYYPTPLEGAVTDPRYWKEEKVNITKEPVSRKIVGELLVERYELSEEEIGVTSDPNLICDLHFR